MRPRKYGIGREHPLALVLVAHGLSVGQAHKVVNTIFDAIKGALKRHETVELPFGTFTVERQKVRRHRRWRFGQPQDAYRRRYRVVFRPREREWE